MYRSLTMPIENITEVVLKNSHPGTILKLDYLPDMGITEYRLAKMLRITQTHLAEILEGKRGVTANTAMRLGKLFGQSPEMWINIQASYDILRERLKYETEIAAIEPFVWPHAEPEVDRAA
jgi:antitoxin HigA-1